MNNGSSAGAGRPAVQRVFAGLLLVLLMSVVVLAAQRGVANLVAQEARYQIDLWRSGKSLPDALKLDALQAELDRAHRLDPSNPILLEDMGRFQASRVDRANPDDPEVRAMRQQALASFRQALEQRPTSAHGYVNVALTKYRLGETDHEFSQALLQALHRGPWEPKVQLMSIELGLAAWQYLGDSGRESLKQAIQAQARWTLVRQKPALQSLLKRYRRADLAYLTE